MHHGHRNDWTRGGFRHFDDFFANGYNRAEDYDTNSAGYYEYLAKVNKYLHYVSHLLDELQETISQIIDKLNELADEIAALEDQMHIPAILVDHNPKPQYLSLGNEPRVGWQGKITGDVIIDVDNQQHFVDTTFLDKTINDMKADIANLYKLIDWIYNRLPGTPEDMDKNYPDLKVMFGDINEYSANQQPKKGAAAPNHNVILSRLTVGENDINVG